MAKTNTKSIKETMETVEDSIIRLEVLKYMINALSNYNSWEYECYVTDYEQKLADGVEVKDYEEKKYEEIKHQCEIRDKVVAEVIEKFL